MERKLIMLLLLPVFLCQPSVAQTLKVISYNIHHGADQEEISTLDEIGGFIRSSGADLVGLQEVDSLCNRSGNVDQMKRLAELTGMHYAFVRHYAYDGGAYGLGILSRYPVSGVRNDRISLSPKEGKKRSLALLSAKITLPDEREVLFSTVHFALDQPTRLIQSAETRRLLKRDIPVILTGDLNAGPGTKEIEQLSAYFSATGPSAAPTYPVGEPVKKIDYIFVSSRDLKKVISGKVLNDIRHSDHLPLSSEIDISAR